MLKHNKENDYLQTLIPVWVSVCIVFYCWCNQNSSTYETDNATDTIESKSQPNYRNTFY